MNEAVDTRPRRYGGVTQLLLLPFTVLGLLCAALLFRLLLEGVGMLFVWPDDGGQHAKTLYEQDRHDLASTPWPNWWQSVSPAWLYPTCSRQLAALSNHRSQMQHMLQSLPSIPSNRTAPLAWVKESTWLKEARSAVRYSMLSVAVRAQISLQGLPLLLLSLFVGVVDGLVRRQVRRFNLQRESSYLHHRAKALFIPVTLLPACLYLALPFCLSPSGLMLASAASSALVATAAIGSFKKYL